MVQLKTAADEGFGVYVVCRSADALSRFVTANVSGRFGQVLESIFSKLSGEEIVVVELNWVKDYQRCAKHFMDNRLGLF